MKTLDPDLLLRAYSIGVFPMSDGRHAEELYWVEPRHRAIIPLDGFHLSHSLRKTIRSGLFDVTRDTAFAEIIRLCAERQDTWINAEIEASYIRLHEAGRAHSLEVWRGRRPIGRRRLGRAGRVRGAGPAARRERPRGGRRRPAFRMGHCAALGPDVVDRVLDDVQRRRFLEQPAGKDAAELAVGAAHVEL